jgi:2-oxo-4-hydroxy-4-carboxy-5-ureidoimidazoline decarboxylase
MEPWQALDAAAPARARQMLRTCCGATRWIDRMMERRPFGSQERLQAVARDEWVALEDADWLEAFAHHPRIGDRGDLARRFPATHQLSSQEQSGVRSADAGVLDALADANRQYEVRFGYIFIVCASGRTADEMLALLRERLKNAAEKELRVAAGEQAKITALRLDQITERT